MKHNEGLGALDAALALVALAIIIGAASLSVAPGSGARRMIGSVASDIRVSVTVRRSWDSIALGSRLGDGAAGPIDLVEFADYECPACRSIYGQLHALRQDAEEPLALVYRHFPLTEIHPRAEGAARAAICAEDQGRFEPMHHLLFTTEDWRETGAWDALARSAGVKDVDGFTTCLDSAATTDRLEEDLKWARRLGLRGTPSFVFRYGVSNRLEDTGVATGASGS